MKLAIPAIILLHAALSGAAEPLPKIAASFYAFGYASGHEKVQIMTGPEAFEEIQLSTANIVGPVAAVAVDGSLRICDKPRTVGGKLIHPVLSDVRIPLGMKRVLVMLFPAPKEANHAYRSLVINHDLKDFPLGVYRMINVSPYPIRGAIAREYITAKPGGVANLEPAGQPGAVVPVRFEFFDQGRWNLLTETRCAIRKDRRWLTCVYQDPVTGRMNIRSIPDRTAAIAGVKE
ncbi:hypothetical protein HZ994_16910 [Akkermansiaceae bacterium]|nr:hypothetical protein HZ994_16910 [Akkermansiaceae bacterium]